MIRFAAMLDSLPRSPSAWDTYAALAPEPDCAAAHALLSGQRPRRIAGLDALVHWAAEEAAVPEWLVQASLAASGDKAEVAALLLPPPTGPAPGVAEVVDRLTRTTRITAHATLLALWAQLPPAASLVVNRLASGTFRTGFPVAPAAPTGRELTLQAVMVTADPLRGEVTLALWDQGVPVPVAQVPLVQVPLVQVAVAQVAVAAPDRTALMAWVRANSTGRFGPVWQVPPVQVFDLTFDGLTRNLRRKSRYALQNPRLTAWRRDLTADQADQLSMLAALFADLPGPLPSPATP